MPILTQAHREHFDEYGYMVIENAIPTELCDAVVDAIFAFLEMDPSAPNDWYRAPHKPGAGMVEMYQHQAMWNVYQHPPIHQIYQSSGRRPHPDPQDSTLLCAVLWDGWGGMPAPFFLMYDAKNVILFTYQLADIHSVIARLRVCLPTM